MSIALPVMADDAASTEQVDSIIMAPVVVTGTRVEQNSFDLPMSIDVTDADQIQEGQLKVNLSESSSRVPGVVINNRNNPAQDLAIQIRGFGARSAFGVRGVRLYADGIPMTMPDGQGQTGTFNLDTASRVEYLRGPFSALYGNSSGGVVQIFTQDGPKDPTLSGGITFGSYNTSRESLSFGDSGDGFDYIVNANTYRSDGYRAQSDTRRDTLHGKINFKFGDDTKLSIVATALDQPDNEDPQGLDAKQLKANRKQAGTGSELFNTRVSRSHQQVGATLDHQFTPDDTVRFMAYYGQRENEQYQSVAVGAQRNDLQGGGVATIDREFGGTDLRWTHNGKVGDNAFSFSVGMNYDRMQDDRKGYENFTSNKAFGLLPEGVDCGNVANAIICGVKGNLRRNETNTATNFDQYLQGSVDLSQKFTLSGGLRHSKVRFNNEDRYIANAPAYAGSNPDDSGAVTFSETTPVIGAIFKLNDSINFYANAGESFETPTFVEMAYKAAGSGLNLDLKPAKSRQYEAGIKALLGSSTLFNVALFKIDTDNEIVVQQQTGGRTVFQNVNSSERKGLELSIDSKFDNGLRAYLAYSYLDAEFTSDFTACKPFGVGQTACNINAPASTNPPAAVGNSGADPVKSGAAIPGTFKHTVYGEVSWKYEPVGFSTALEARANSKTYVAFKPEYGSAGGYVVAAWRGGFTQKINNWKFNEFVRVENLFDKDYVGSVRVADLNGRYYEPAPGRNWLLGVNASYKF
ncbi:TonB-dependent receptor [Methylotenera sp.]|uniref:TonB-dependent receptor family protein n=1 Tax=Methylotenera sp. TaxID=2051956 RepID=UPI00272FD060|nr:TonB-dependent receptor [Methylotenera sp.]MDP2229893.1 TonB-dependent receptor [Methylotenera sp.]MDP3141602.1 TonB-dependent receptor [Methylotenera sp.]